MTFFNKTDESAEIIDDRENPQTSEDEGSGRIKIGSEEFDPTEAERLIALGKIAHEAEERYDTKIDRVWPQYQRTQQELRDLRGEMDGLRASTQQQAQTAAGVDQATVQQAREAAKTLGIVTEDAFQDYMLKNFRPMYQQAREVEELVSQVQSLAEEIDGKDGRPKFYGEEILEYMDQTGIKNPLKAYKDKYEDKLDVWKDQQRGKDRRNGFYTAAPGSTNKQPAQVKINQGNISDALTEALGDY